MQYDIITYTRGVNDSKEEAAKKMAEKVNEYLKDGWRLNGSLCVDGGTFYQSVKKEKTTRER